MITMMMKIATPEIKTPAIGRATLPPKRAMIKPMTPKKTPNIAMIKEIILRNGIQQPRQAKTPKAIETVPKALLDLVFICVAT